MYDEENKSANGGTENSTNGEYRYTGPFYTDSYSSGSNYSGNSYGGSGGYSGDSYQGGGSYRQNSSIGEVKKKKKKGGWFLKTVCIALVFGIVASAAFQATNYIGRKAIGEEVTLEDSSDSTVILPKVNDTSGVVSDGSSSASTLDVRSVVRSCMPSMVAITNVSVAEVPNFWGFWGGDVQQEQVGAGTGIVIGMNDSELLILTNNHVTADAKTLTVVFSVDEGKDEAQAVEARVKGADVSRDVSVISVKLSDIPEETLENVTIATIGDSSSLEVGEPVVAIGNALGYGQSVTNGIISALNREVPLQMQDGTVISNKLIQTNAAINGGNSGGALLNMKGEVIGINEAKAVSDDAENMGYAIPISDVESIIGDLSLRTTRDKVDEARVGYMGVGNCQDVTPEVSEQFDMPVGIYVGSVVEGSGAEKAGMKKGDIITKLDKLSVTTFDELREQLNYYSAGETVEVVVQSPTGSEYVEKTLQVKLSLRRDLE